MATKKNAAPAKSTPVEKAVAPVKRAVKKTAAAAVKSDVPDPTAKVSTQMTAKRTTRSNKPVTEKAAAKPAAKKVVAKKKPTLATASKESNQKMTAASDAYKATRPAATKTIVSPATTKAIAAGAVAVKSLGVSSTKKKPANDRIFKSLDASSVVNSSTKNDPVAKAAANQGLAVAAETKPAAKPARRTYKASVTAGLKKRAEDLIADAAAAGLKICIAHEGGKPGVKFYEA